MQSTEPAQALRLKTPRKIQKPNSKVNILVVVEKTHAKRIKTETNNCTSTNQFADIW